MYRRGRLRMDASVKALQAGSVAARRRSTRGPAKGLPPAVSINLPTTCGNGNGKTPRQILPPQIRAPSAINDCDHSHRVAPGPCRSGTPTLGIAHRALPLGCPEVDAKVRRPEHGRNSAPLRRKSARTSAVTREESRRQSRPSHRSDEPRITGIPSHRTMTPERKESGPAATPTSPTVGRWSRPVAREFLAWLGLRRISEARRGLRTGALSQAILETAAPRESWASTGAPPTSPTLASGWPISSPLRRADAQALPFAARSSTPPSRGPCSTCVPPRRALAEMRRAVRPGGAVASTSGTTRPDAAHEAIRDARWR